MTAQDATKARKNAKARREKKKQDNSKDSPSVRTEKGGASMGSPGPKGNMVERIVKYWRGVVAETKRVSWPGKPELIAGTVTSVVVLMVFASWLGGIDFLLRKIFG